MSTLLFDLPGYIDSAEVGSEAILPGHEGNDRDVVVLVASCEEAGAVLAAEAWEREGDASYGASGSWRSGRENIILTESFAFFASFNVASKLCRWLAVSGALELMQERDNRVHVHKEIRALALSIESRGPLK